MTRIEEEDSTAEAFGLETVNEEEGWDQSSGKRWSRVHEGEAVRHEMEEVGESNDGEPELQSYE